MRDAAPDADEDYRSKERAMAIAFPRDAMKRCIC
jgi:hypothetical protein